VRTRVRVCVCVCTYVRVRTHVRTYMWKQMHQSHSIFKWWQVGAIVPGWPRAGMSHTPSLNRITQHDPIIFVLWLIPTWRDSFLVDMTYFYVTWLILIWHDSCTFVLWLISVGYVTWFSVEVLSRRWRDVLQCVARDVLQCIMDVLQCVSRHVLQRVSWFRNASPWMNDMIPIWLVHEWTTWFREWITSQWFMNESLCNVSLRMNHIAQCDSFMYHRWSVNKSHDSVNESHDRNHACMNDCDRWMRL